MDVGQEDRAIAQDRDIGAHRRRTSRGQAGRTGRRCAPDRLIACRFRDRPETRPFIAAIQALLTAAPRRSARPMTDTAPQSSARDTPKSARTRARILDCALRLFAAIGYGQASNARIAEEAGLTRGAMLYHFPTREALVEAAAAYIHTARSALMA